MVLHGFYRKLKSLYPTARYDEIENIITVSGIGGNDVDHLIVEVDSITENEYDGKISYCSFSVVDEFQYVQVIPVLTENRIIHDSVL